MSSRTKIVVLHMKELIYTGIFAALGILLIILLAAMFLPKKDGDAARSGTGREEISGQDESGGSEDSTGQKGSRTVPDESTDPDTAAASGSVYIPGIYTTELILNDQTIDVEVIVDQSSITSVRLVNLSDAVTTMYPLLQPTFDSICQQIYEKQSLEGITYESENKYTSLVLLEAVKSSLEKARP